MMENREILDFFKQMDYKEENMESDDTISISCAECYAKYQILGTRPNQQDSIGVNQRGEELLAVLCDGMGGLAGGEIASQSVVKTFLDDFEKSEKQNISEFLFQEAIRLDRVVYELKDASGNQLGAGTTLAAIFIKEKKMYYVSIGDSRIYILRGEEIVPLTEDQNYRMTLNRALEKGEISQDEYKKEERYADALISYLGMGGLKVIECSSDPIELFSGDKILLCSDGLYKRFSDEQIKESLKNSTSETIENVLRNLLEKALNAAIEEGKGQDNTSAILILEK